MPSVSSTSILRTGKHTPRGCWKKLARYLMSSQRAPAWPSAALNRVFTLQRDSRDGAHAERGTALLSEDVLARCHGQANCTDVCPIEISPTDSILALRRRAVMRLFGFSQR